MGAGLLLLLWLVWFFSDLVLYLAVGAVLAYLMGPIVARLQGLGLPHMMAVLGAFVAVIGGVVFAAMLLVPFLAAQVSSVSSLLSPERLADVAASLDAELHAALPAVDEGVLQAQLVEVFDTLFQRERLTAAFSSVLGVFADVALGIIVVPFVAFFLLKDGQRFQRRLLGLVPNRYFEPTLALVGKVEATIGRYFRALLFQMLSVGTMATVLLWLVGLDGALAVGLFTALANTIPYFGPALGFAAGAVVGIAQTGDFSLVPGVAVAMLVTQVSDNVLFQPFYFARAARVHPLVILCTVLIGARLAGILGMLVAIPVLTVVLVTVRQILWSLREYRLLNPSLPRDTLTSEITGDGGPVARVVRR